MARNLSIPTLYEVLGISQKASVEEIKAAYRHKLLSSHPDKVSVQSNNFDAARVQDAYRVLSDTSARASYDAKLTVVHRDMANSSISSGPRPAQVVSLDEFSFREPDEHSVAAWTHACRCGGTYSITELTMEEGGHLITCDQCSEIIYVGYELLEENKEKDIRC